MHENPKETNQQNKASVTAAVSPLLFISRIAQNLKIAIKKLAIETLNYGKPLKCAFKVVFQMYPSRGVTQKCHANTSFDIYTGTTCRVT